MKTLKRSYIQVLYFGLIFLLGSLSSCLVTKKFQAPEYDEPPLFSLDTLSGSGLRVGNYGWRAFFTDSLLRKFIDSTLQNNYDNQIAYERVLQAQSSFKQGKIGYIPTLSLSGQVEHQDLSSAFQFAPSEQYTLSGALSWEADIWGKITSAKRMLKAQFQQSVTAKKLMQTQLVAKTANAYYALIALKESRILLERTLVLRERGLISTIRLFDAGMSNQLAVEQARAQVESVRVMLEENKRSVTMATNTLIMLTGGSLQTMNLGTVEDQRTPETVDVGVPVEALRNRPDVQVSELAFRAAFENFNIAKASLYPTLTISAMGGFQSSEFDKWFTSSSLFNTLIGGLTQPIFMTRKLRTQKEIADSQRREALLDFQKTLLEASTELSNLMESYGAYQRSLLELRRQEEHLSRAFVIAEQLMEYGNATYLDILTAQEALLNVQLSLIQAESNRLQTLVGIYRAVGGGVE
ncbi:TolC family protein [Fulvitalea axinellae]